MRSLTSVPRLDAERNLAGMIICANTCACIGTTLRPRRSRFPPSHARSSSCFFSFSLHFVLLLDFTTTLRPYDHFTTASGFLFLSSLIHFSLFTYYASILHWIDRAWLYRLNLFSFSFSRARVSIFGVPARLHPDTQTPIRFFSCII